MDMENLDFYRAALAIRRRRVRPLLPQISRGGEATVRGEQAVTVAWAAGDRRLVLDANLSDARVVFREAKDVFWRWGDPHDDFGPWSVRWSVDSR